MSQLIKNTGVYQRLTSGTNELERMFKEVDENQPSPDIKKILLLLGLGTLSWISTYSGLLELIKANSGDIAVTYKLAIGFAVAMLMLMIVYILDQLFSPLNWAMRTIYIAGYIFLTIISVGFGFGFYWKFLESRSEATRSAESAVTEVQTALQGGQTRLEQLETTLTTLTALSTQKAIEEREKGNSCPNSRPGDGPRRRLRDEDAKNFTYAGNFITKRSKAVANDIKLLNDDMVKIASRHPSTVDPATGTRNAFLKKLNQRLDLTITRFNAFRTDPQLSSMRNNLAERSTQTIFPNGKNGTFKCPDNQLQSALRGVVQAIDELPVLAKPKIAAVEGSEATIEAFRRLAATLKGAATLHLPPSEEELRATRKKAIRSLDPKKSPLILTNGGAGLNDRDHIPLAIAVFVDFCLLLVSINRPMDRLKSLVPVMKDARDGPISGILSSFHATHFAGIREEFSLFQHVVFDWGGHYYVAVPLASNDIQAQYLANLFVSLEGRGIVDRAMIPPAFIIRSKLKKMGSSFAEHRAFRLYKFRNGAWSNIVLDAVMGAARDVAIENRSLKSNSKLPHPDILDEKDQVRQANFESLFEDDQPTIDGTPNLQHANAAHDEGAKITMKNEPFIEMPRLFRRKKSDPLHQSNKRDASKLTQSTSLDHKQNQLSTHFNGSDENTGMRAHATESATDQPQISTIDPVNNQLLGEDSPPPNNLHIVQSNLDVNGKPSINGQDTADIISWPLLAVPEQRADEKFGPLPQQDQINGRPLVDSLESYNQREQEDLNNCAQPIKTNTSFNTHLNANFMPPSLDSRDKRDDSTHQDKEDVTVTLDAEASEAIGHHPLAAMISDTNQGQNDKGDAYPTRKMMYKETLMSDDKEDTDTLTDNAEIIPTNQPNADERQPEIALETPEHCIESDPPLSKFEALTTVKDHIAVRKITDWYRGEKAQSDQNSQNPISINAIKTEET